MSPGFDPIGREVVSVTYPLPVASRRPPIPAVAEARGDAARMLRFWLHSQDINARRALRLLRNFRLDDFPSSAAGPTEAHLHATNRLLTKIRAVVGRNALELAGAVRDAGRRSDRAALDRVTRLKEESVTLVGQAERIWHYYSELFAQRTGRMAARLLACDRIALDCYQYVYQGLGKARPIPSPPPLTVLEPGSGPATFRRGVRLARIGLFPNPFPVVKLPDHRLVCPWTLGAIPHEVAHNLQSDLGLWLAIPRRLVRTMRAAGLPREVWSVWARWQKEIVADLFGVLLIGPAYVASLTDVVGRSQAATVAWNGDGVHPTPFLRVLINLELLRRMGFAAEARAMRRAWFALYPPVRARSIPFAVRRQFVRAMTLTVDVLVDAPYDQLGGRSLRQVVCFRPQDQVVAREAARRLARGADPGIIPERFLLAAVRIAFDHRLASADVLSLNFYASLGRR